MSPDRTMQAALLEAHAVPFRLVTVPRPTADAGQVLIKIAASGVNPLDLKIREGVADHARQTLPAILGIDLAGTVVAVGQGVTRFRPGDEVFGMAGGVGGLQGSLAQYAAVNADLLAFKPRNLGMREASVMPLVFITAWEGLVDRMAVQTGQTLLVLGGAGGVGQMAIQIALARGATVFATGSIASQETIERLGARFIDRSEPISAAMTRLTAARGFDLVFDSVGGTALDGAFGAVRRFGHVASALGWGTHALAPLSFRAATYSGIFTLLPLLTGEGRAHHGEILSEASRLAETGQLVPSLDPRRFTLGQVDDAYRLVGGGQARGKISIDIEATARARKSRDPAKSRGAIVRGKAGPVQGPLGSRPAENEDRAGARASVQGEPDQASPRFYEFMRNCVGAGEIRGARERWIAPAALYTGGAGIGEASWTITPETVLALRLHGAPVEDHNRRVTRISGPGREFALQPRGTPTRYLAHGSIRFGQVFLPDALLDRASGTENLPALSGRLREDLSFVPEKTLHTLTSDYLRRAFDMNLPATSLEMEGRALLLVDWLLRLHGSLRPGGVAQAGGLSLRNLRRVCDFMAEHLAEDICLDDLAALTGLTAKHFARAFRQSTGLPPHHYLIVQRIETAKRHLDRASPGLADIALACGFADQSHFTATFRRVVGVTPGTWRLHHVK